MDAEVADMKYIASLFTIEYNDKNVSLDVLNKFIESYKSELTNILEQLNIQNMTIPLHLFNKDALDNYVKLNSISYKNTHVPSWLVGFSSSETICLLEPNEANLDNMIKVALHESVHYILYNMYPNAKRSKLLDEGLATYYSKQNTAYDLKCIKEDYTNDNLKNISSLNTNDSIKFANIKGYSYCYYVIDFLMQNFGIEKIFKWYNNDTLFNENISKLNLDAKFTFYLHEKIND